MAFSGGIAIEQERNALFGLSKFLYTCRYWYKPIMLINLILISEKYFDVVHIRVLLPISCRHTIFGTIIFIIDKVFLLKLYEIDFFDLMILCSMYWEPQYFQPETILKII